MTGTPQSLADPPDLLSELLRAVRLQGSVFLNGRFSEPFGVISPARWDEGHPMARLRHVSVFHLIAEGECRLETEDGEVVQLQAGDVVLLPFTTAHRLWAGQPGAFAYGPDIILPGPVSGVGVVDHGGGGDATRLVCGFLESSELLPAPLFRALPPVLIERTGDDPVAGAIAATATQILGQVDVAGPGAQALLGRLMEALFVEVLRRHAARLPSDAGGMLAATRDPIVSKAIFCMHQQPARKWTIEDLAAEANASRTVLGERFNQRLGKPPIEYLTAWRIQLAAERLRAGPEPLGRIAEGVGYDSEAAFSRAFKREMGVSPGAWRTG